MRLLMFPLVIKSQRNVAHMHNHMPTMTRLQEKFTIARQSGNAVEGTEQEEEDLTPVISFISNHMP